MWFSHHKLVLSHWDQAAFQMPSCWTLEEHKLESHPHPWKAMRDAVPGVHFTALLWDKWS